MINLFFFKYNFNKNLNKYKVLTTSDLLFYNKFNY